MTDTTAATATTTAITDAQPAMPQRSLILLACLIATFGSAIEGTIVATAMPSIVARLGDFSLFAWVFSIYLLGQAVSIPLYGRLADIYGRKRVFYFGATLFLVGSALCGLSTSMPMLVIFRTLQGIGAGGLQPVANTIVADIYSPAERARMQGLISAVYCSAAVAGPSLGSLLVHYESWRIVFWLNIPFSLASILLIKRFLHETVPDRPHRVDYRGSILLLIGFGALMYAVRILVMDLMHGNWFGNGTGTGAAVIGALALTLLAFHERRFSDPILPMELWGNRVIVIGCLGGAIVGSLLMGVAVFLPAYVQGVMGASPLVSGFVLAMMSVLWTIASVAAGPLLSRTSYRITAAIGGLMLLSGSVTLVSLTAQDGIAWAATGSSLIGVGMGLCTTTFIVSIQSAVPWQERGVATASVMFLRSLGQALGVAIFGMVVNLTMVALDPGAAPYINQLLHSTSRAGLPPATVAQLTRVLGESLHAAFILAGLLAAITLLLAIRLPRKVNLTNQPASG